jgi:UDP-glucose 4-epimerase
LKVLILGGTGFVGLNIATVLLARGHRVNLFDRVGLPTISTRSSSQGR